MFLKGIIIQGLEVNKSATWEKHGAFIRAGMFMGIKKIYKVLLYFRDVCTVDSRYLDFGYLE